MPANLPAPTRLNQNIHGAFIIVRDHNNKSIQGELLAADESGITLLGDYSCIKIDRTNIRYYTVYYAKGKNFAWTIPVLSAMTLMHGYYSAISLPLNLVLTTAITITEFNRFRLTSKVLPLRNLKDYARFPQGLPTEFDLPVVAHN